MVVGRSDRVRRYAQRGQRGAGGRSGTRPIAQRDTALNAFTAVTVERARARGATQPKGPLAGVPFAVKNLFDIAGLSTLAGSRINREHAAATADATLITRLEVLEPFSSVH